MNAMRSDLEAAQEAAISAARCRAEQECLKCPC